MRDRFFCKTAENSCGRANGERSTFFTFLYSAELGVAESTKARCSVLRVKAWYFCVCVIGVESL